MVPQGPSPSNIFFSWLGVPKIFQEKVSQKISCHPPGKDLGPSCWLLKNQLFQFFRKAAHGSIILGDIFANKNADENRGNHNVLWRTYLVHIGKSHSTKSSLIFWKYLRKKTSFAVFTVLIGGTRPNKTDKTIHPNQLNEIKVATRTHVECYLHILSWGIPIKLRLRSTTAGILGKGLKPPKTIAQETAANCRTFPRTSEQIYLLG